jgi:alkylhydroperoxidase/carboxymuconolactone decarboxylase family protein YurZ
MTITAGSPTTRQPNGARPVTIHELESDLEPSLRATQGRQAMEALVPGVPGLIDASLRGLSPATARRIFEHIWGDVYATSPLSTRELTIAAIAGLTAMGGADTNLVLQASVALRVGLKPSEVVAVIEHAATYAGFPRSQAALQAVRGVLDQASTTATE